MQIRLALLLLLLITPAFAAVTVEPLDLRFAVPVVAVIVVIFLAISNMLANAISNPRLQAWAKTEFREFVAGLILIAVITGLFVGSTTGVSIALTGQENYVEASQDILDEWINAYDSAFSDIIRAGSRVRGAATYSPYINIPIYWVSLSYSGNPLGGASILLISLNVAGQSMTNVTFLYEGIRLLVLYLKIIVQTIFLPVAFIMRLIPFTRRIGNTLIALALAGIVFLPFSIILADSMNDTLGDGYPQPRLSGSKLKKLDADPWAMVAMEPLCEAQVIRLLLSLTDPLFAIVVCLPLFFIPIAGPGLFNACKPLVEFVIYPIIQVVFQLVMAGLLASWTAFYNLGGAEDYAKEAFDVLYPFLRDANNLVLMGYLDFILIVIITISGAKALSTALGGEWYMAGVQRLI
jgi:hypothetical protein